MKKLILFGCGHIGREALEILGKDNVYCYCDNHVKNEEIEGKPLIDYGRLLEIHSNYIKRIRIA